MRTTEVHPSADSWADEQFPGKHHGGTSRLYVCGDNAANKRRRSFIHARRPFAVGDNVISATLHLYAKFNWAAGTHTLHVVRLTGPWAEKTVNWNNQPGTGGADLTFPFTGVVDQQELQLDVTAIFTDAALGSAYRGLRVSLPDADTAKLAFHSAEHPLHRLRPWLEIKWSEQPEEPRDGAPAGNNAVSKALPTLDYRFGVKGRDPDQLQSSKQLQISTSTSFASPEYDSGKIADERTLFDFTVAPLWTRSLGTATITIASPGVVTNTAHGLVADDPVRFTTTGALPTGLSTGTTYYVLGTGLTTNTFRLATTPGGAAINTSGTQSGTHTLLRVGIADGTSRYYRIKAWDTDDVASNFSDTWQFQRSTKGTLALNSPPVGPPSVVHDLTPPITWVVTGRTQEQYEITLFRQRADGTWKRIWLLPRRVGTDTSVNVPAGLIDRNGTFLVRVKVWDTIDRQSTPGDPKWMEVSRQFTYTRDGTPAAVTNLSATPFGAGILVQWDDATEPDFYCFTVNNQEVIPRIEPVDVLVTAGSPSHYAYIYYRGEHDVPQTIEVERVVNSAGSLFHSGTNPTATVTPDVLGKWLVDDTPGDQEALQFLNAEQSTFQIGEDGATFNPSASRRPIRIASAFRGLEGSISGILESNIEKDTFLDLKGRGVSRRLRYIAQGLNMPVIVAEVSLSPKADAPRAEQWVVTADLLQQGEFFDVVGIDQADDE